MAKLYDLAVPVREYQDRDGNTKKQWQNIGAVMEGRDGGQYIYLARWFNPAGIPGEGDLAISCFEPRDRSQNGAGKEPDRSQDHQSRDMDDEIPF